MEFNLEHCSLTKNSKVYPSQTDLTWCPGHFLASPKPPPLFPSDPPASLSPAVPPREGLEASGGRERGRGRALGRSPAQSSPRFGGAAGTPGGPAR